MKSMIGIEFFRGAKKLCHYWGGGEIEEISEQTKQLWTEQRERVGEIRRELEENRGERIEV